jgi:hypothetical protein
MEEMAKALDDSVDVALVYANQYISHLENETFDECVARGASIRRWPEYTPEDLLMRCITGSQPMWRKSLHLATGEFNTDYSIAADYDLWLRVASKDKLLHIGQTLGVLYDSPTTISGANSRIKLNQEILKLKRENMEHEPWRSVKLKIQKQLAASFYGMAYQLISVDSSGKSAAGLLKEALRLDPLNLKFAKTYLLRCVLSIGRFYK